MESRAVTFCFDCLTCIVMIVIVTFLGYQIPSWAWPAEKKSFCDIELNKFSFYFYQSCVATDCLVYFIKMDKYLNKPKWISIQKQCTFPTTRLLTGLFIRVLNSVSLSLLCINVQIVKSGACFEQLCWALAASQLRFS